MNKQKTIDEIRDIISRVRYRDWVFSLRTDPLSVQVQFFAPDLITHESSLQYGRWWLLSPSMTETEIVLTLWSAVRMAIEHEAREEFKYRAESNSKWRSPLQSHVNIRTLYDAASRSGLDIRETEKTGEWTMG